MGSKSKGKQPAAVANPQEESVADDGSSSGENTYQPGQLIYFQGPGPAQRYYAGPIKEVLSIAGETCYEVERAYGETRNPSPHDYGPSTLQHIPLPRTVIVHHERVIPWAVNPPPPFGPDENYDIGPAEMAWIFSDEDDFSLPPPLDPVEGEAAGDEEEDEGGKKNKKSKKKLQKKHKKGSSSKSRH